MTAMKDLNAMRTTDVPKPSTHGRRQTAALPWGEWR